MNQERQCCELLANYLCSLTKLSARWVSFTRPSHRIESTNSDCVDCLSDLMGLEYNSMYLPFMQECQLLELPENGRCNDAEVTLITEGYAVILHIFDAIFSYARLPSCTVTEELVADLRIFVQEGLRLWRGLDLSITPKVHAIEDHLCDQMLLFKGIGDLGEDFVEQSHQDGIKDHRRLKNPASHIISAEWQSKWEHVRKHPKVLRVQRQVQQHANKGTNYCYYP